MPAISKSGPHDGISGMVRFYTKDAGPSRPDPDIPEPVFGDRRYIQMVINDFRYMDLLANGFFRRIDDVKVARVETAQDTSVFQGGDTAHMCQVRYRNREGRQTRLTGFQIIDSSVDPAKPERAVR